MTISARQATCWTVANYDGSVLKLAFFGQINWFKGLDLLLDAVALLPTHLRKKVQLDINGSGLEKQPKSLQRVIGDKLKQVEDVARYRGTVYTS